jgi:hypothetical protein
VMYLGVAAIPKAIREASGKRNDVLQSTTQLHTWEEPRQGKINQLDGQRTVLTSIFPPTVSVTTLHMNVLELNNLTYISPWVRSLQPMVASQN